MAVTPDILLVEDDRLVRELTVTMLSRLGYNVFEAKDGQSALRKLEQLKHVDLLS